MRTGKRWWAVDLPTWLLLAGVRADAELVDEAVLMPVDPDLLELYVDEVVIEPWVSKDFGNVETFGAAVTYRAKIDAHVEEIPRDSGDVAKSSHRVALDDIYAVGERDRITMPSNGRFAVSQPEILKVHSWTDENPVTTTELGHHTTVIVGGRRTGSA
ncbi:MAG: hypothetical protein GY769_04440 [bacterium]|nr:hypothetical protein [bacterium]